MLNSAMATGTVGQKSAVSAMAVATSVFRTKVKTSGPSLLPHSMLKPGRQYTWP